MGMTLKFDADRTRFDPVCDGQFTGRSKSCPDLGTDRIAARLHCHVSDGHARPLIYDVVKVFDWTRCVLMSVLFEDDSRARPNSIHSEFKLMLRPSLLSFVTYFRFPLLPLSFFHRPALPTLFLPMNFIYSTCLNRVYVSVHMSLHLCMSAYNSWSVSQCIHVHSCTAYNALSLQRPEVTDRARSREEYLEER